MEFKINVFRDVLIFLEKNLSYDNTIYSRDIKVKNYSPDDIAYALDLIAEQDFIVYEEEKANTDRYTDYFIRRLTMNGHEFLASVKNDTVWKKIVKLSGEIGVEAIMSTIPILIAYTKSQLCIP